MKLTEKLIEQKSELAAKIIKKARDEMFSSIALIYDFERENFNQVEYYNGFDDDLNCCYVKLNDLSSSKFIIINVFSKSEYSNLEYNEQQEFYENRIEECSKKLEQLL